jgi:threonine aldolase
MREVMKTAPVDDSMYGTCPSTNRLTDYMSHLVGKDDAIFVPSGTMANIIATMVIAGEQDSIIVGHKAHIMNYKVKAGMTKFAGIYPTILKH